MCIQYLFLSVCFNQNYIETTSKPKCWNPKWGVSSPLARHEETLQREANVVWLQVLGRRPHISGAKVHRKFITKKRNGIWVSELTQKPIRSLKKYPEIIIFRSVHSFFGKMHSESLCPIMGIAQERAVTLAHSLCHSWADERFRKAPTSLFPQITRTLRGRTEDPGSVTSWPPYLCSCHPVLRIDSAQLISVWAASWVMHKWDAGPMWTTGEISNQILRPLSLSGLASPPIHTWKVLLAQPLVAGRMKSNTMLCYYSLWRNPNNNQIHDKEPPAATIQVKSGSCRSYQSPQNIHLKHPIF